MASNSLTLYCNKCNSSMAISDIMMLATVPPLRHMLPYEKTKKIQHMHRLGKSLVLTLRKLPLVLTEFFASNAMITWVQSASLEKIN